MQQSTPLPGEGLSKYCRLFCKALALALLTKQNVAATTITATAAAPTLAAKTILMDVGNVLDSVLASELEDSNLMWPSRFCMFPTFSVTLNLMMLLSWVLHSVMVVWGGVVVRVGGSLVGVVGRSCGGLVVGRDAGSRGAVVGPCEGWVVDCDRGSLEGVVVPSCKVREMFIVLDCGE